MAVDELLAQFHEIAASPKKQLEKYLAQGKKVVACAPVYTPEEIIHSMGLVPMGVWGADQKVGEAKKYYPAFICSIMQTVLELGITGKYQGVSAIVIPSLCDSLKCLGQNWKYAVPDIPFIPMTYPQNRKPSYGIAFTKAGYERVISDLSAATGAKFSEVALADSNRIYNEHNAVMREFAEIAADHAVSAAQRSDVFKSAWFMRKEEHTAMVKQLNAELAQTPKDKGKIRVVVSGILADSPSLLEIFDKNEIRIAADDVAFESRQYRTDVPEDPNSLDALARKYANMDNCSVLYDRDKKRVDSILELAKRHDARGVIVLMTKFCDPEEFDYVPIKRACEAAGLLNLNIEVDRQMVNYEQANTMIQTFREMF
ncbi:(R)-2-hydroxyisocaproyl-CoA dehydratase beta subunit [Caprobacter fermentans]|uniref:(R)-2-hydroxyisocaproyl-CoA dehydratase beta subunit n=1 Tax=Caproicibacter fermentans TaxID=2576756 RepID=A0A6N8HUU2_9FIRM|nr:2-hydroxyacyl-CoA dehydratase family protein [Caproicibacter fermentans]MVB09561.1 (R)-2-hydroxyisocaproyl-CoA dehydratase beta subunit [Caproicibacter fermentans]OCN02170.1 benzoyl-CoA reductase [Clostridium sp. W14A]QNK41422.1 2-hydroxyacyl-CoA dehydratase [Caproicibacter fermentans]